MRALVLIAVVVTQCCAPHCGAAPSPPNDQVTKIGEAIFVEGIQIDNSSKDEQPVGSAPEVAKLILGQSPIHDRECKPILSPPQSHDTVPVQRRQGAGEVKRGRICDWEEANSACSVDEICGSLSRVHVVRAEFKPQPFDAPLSKSFASASGDIGPQLASSVVVGSRDQFASSEPKKHGNGDQQRLTKLEGQKRHLGSVVASILCILIAWRISRTSGTFGMIVFIYAIAGLIGQFDLFSIFLNLR